MTTRLYRLTPTDRTGWFLGLTAAQVVPLISGLLLAALTLTVSQSLGAALIPAVTGAAAAFSRIGGRPALEAAPAAVAWWTRRGGRRFEAPVPLPGPGPALPEGIGGCELATLTGPDGDMVVATDPDTGVMSTTLRVAADSPFLLAAAGDQERILAAFGDALAPLCRNGRRSFTVRWSSFAAPAGVVPPGAVTGVAVDAYHELLALVAGTAHHDVLLTVTLAGTRSRHDPASTELLTKEARLLAGRLADSGLMCEPLDQDAFGVALRRRLDPAERGSVANLASLAELAGFAAVAGAGPMCAEEHWDHIRLDGTVHRAYHVLEWPRSAIPAAWAGDLLLSLPVVRTFCVVFEPVAPRSSRRQVDRQAAKLDSDEEQRRRAGFRIGADHDATKEALSAREAELVAGHPEFDYAGLVVLSAPTLDELDARDSDARSAAAAAGVELAPLHGRHAAALAVCLPLPRVLAGRTR